LTGLAIARRLRALGLSVTVLEQTGIASGASGVQPGGVRQQWGTAVNCRLARESARFYQEAEENLETQLELGFRACGYLFLAHTPAVLEQFERNVAVQHELGIPSRVVSAEEAAEILPGLQSDGLAGAAWCQEDGYFDRPQSVVEAFAAGTDVVIDEVLSIERDGAGWALRLFGGRETRTDVVVIAAGADSRGLLASLGVELPIEREPRFLFYSTPISERLLEPLVISPERYFAAKQLGNGRVLASDLRATGDPERNEPGWRATVRAASRELLPILEYVDYPILTGGDYDVTPDRQAILGELPELDGLWVAAGFSGHGFMLAPAVARIVADAIAGAPRDEALAVLDPARFEEGRLVPEPAVI
jgi:sarcosine oxidase subunit beta